jgi:hypothetical protein
MRRARVPDASFRESFVDAPPLKFLSECLVTQQADADHYSLIAKVPGTIGARTSAYYGQVGKHNSRYLAVPGRANRGAELWVYETRD